MGKQERTSQKGNRFAFIQLTDASGMYEATIFSERLTQAREMLELGTQKIDQIAYRIGYEDPGAFTKLFQAQIGLTPSEYRKRFGVG